MCAYRSEPQQRDDVVHALHQDGRRHVEPPLHRVGPLRRGVPATVVPRQVGAGLHLAGQPDVPDLVAAPRGHGPAGPVRRGLLGGRAQGGHVEVLRRVREPQRQHHRVQHRRTELAHERTVDALVERAPPVREQGLEVHELRLLAAGHDVLEVQVTRAERAEDRQVGAHALVVPADGGLVGAVGLHHVLLPPVPGTTEHKGRLEGDGGRQCRVDECHHVGDQLVRQQRLRLEHDRAALQLDEHHLATAVVRVAAGAARRHQAPDVAERVLAAGAEVGREGGEHLGDQVEAARRRLLEQVRQDRVPRQHVRAAVR